jgi:hypothetical protein
MGSGESLPEPTGAKSARDLFPYVEDWIALQGGRPRVFRKKDNPNSAWIVIHVYEEHPDAKRRFKSGAIIPTSSPSETGFQMLRKGLRRRDDEGNLVDRDFMIPSFMNIAVHGDVCRTRSGTQGGGDYDRIRNQEEYEAKLRSLAGQGYEEMRFGVDMNNEGFTLTPLPEIRPPKPLGQ